MPVLTQVVKPLADDVAENARPKTDEFIDNVLRPAIEDFKRMLEQSADELAEQVRPLSQSLPTCLSVSMKGAAASCAAVALPSALSAHCCMSSGEGLGFGNICQLNNSEVD